MKTPFRSLYFGLMFRFLLFLTAGIVTVVAGISALGAYADRILINYAGEVIAAGSRVIRYSAESGVLELDAEYPDYFAIEVLSGNEVVYRQGARLGGETRYSQEELSTMIQRHYRFMPEVDYIPEYVPFTGTDGLPYALLIKIPKDAPEAHIRAGVMIPQYLAGSELESAIFRMIRNVLLTTLGVLLLLVLLLSRLTWHSVIYPLRELNRGLTKVNSNALDTVITFRAHREFEEVRDAFNSMAAKLYRQQQENVRLTEAKKQFILDLSHDLRTPITTINGYAEALADGLVKTEEQRLKYLTYIRNKSHLMSDLINRLFDYARLESGRQTMRREPTDIADCFRETIIAWYGELEAGGFELDITIPDEQVPYFCSRLEMERALGNIISNQIKYNPPGTPIRYSLSSTDESVELLLADDGIGIEEDILDRIFDVMVRGDESRHGVAGTGLGLAITKKVIDLHDGTIRVESRPGEGTSFYISLPKLKKI